MVWWPFAPKPERADTTEVTDLNNGAPPLHSAQSVVDGSLLGRGFGNWEVAFPRGAFKVQPGGCL